MDSFLQTLHQSAAGSWQLVNERTGKPVAERLILAFDSAARRKGLLGRDSLPTGTGMIIAPTNAVHTFFMRFPIDIVFAARDGRALKLRAAVQPWRIAVAMRAYSVVELPSGTLAAIDLRVGDYLRVRQHGSD